MNLLAPIASARCTLVVLTPDLIATMRGEDEGAVPFRWPSWWPDETDHSHLGIWAARAGASEAHVAWGPRAIVDAHGLMVGHAGFHLPPRPIDEALSDPSFVGTRDPSRGGVVEVGYTTFPEFRSQGFASEAVTALMDWAALAGAVATVVAAVAEDNRASLRVLDRVGGFERIGTCRDDDGTVETVFRREL